MKPVSKHDLASHITRTYWSFWCWLFLTVVAIINMIVTPSLFAACVILINISVMAERYKAHKCMRAEYDRRYSWSTDSSVDESEETE
jgi:hypothetical protein